MLNSDNTSGGFYVGINMNQENNHEQRIIRGGVILLI